MTCKYSLAAAILASTLVVASQSSAIPVDLGTAGNFVILAKSGISTTGTTAIVGDLGASPVSATSITGFGLVLDASGTFATSSLVVGRVFASNYAAPTPANLTTAVSDMETAYTDAAGRPADVTGLGAGNIGGLMIAPGVYKWGTGVTIPTDVTLSGGASDVWIFQIAGTLVTSSSTKVLLTGGAVAENVFWQVAGQVTLGTMSQFKGTILGQTAIVMNTGATLDGRALAQTAVTLQSNAVSQAVSGLFDDFLFIANSKDPVNNTCTVGVTGMEFEAFGEVTGIGTAGQVVRISYDTPQPTSTRRSNTKVSVRQKKYSTLNVRFDGVSATGGPVIIEKCSVDGSADTVKLKGSVKVDCNMAPLYSRLTADQIASMVTAFQHNSKVRITRKFIAIRCKGDAFGY